MEVNGQRTGAGPLPAPVVPATRPAIRKALSLLLLAVAGASRAQDTGWDWMVEPYAWAATIGTDLQTRSPPIEGEGELRFPDILDKLDGVFQLRVEGQGDRAGLFADFTYLGIASDRTGRIAETSTDLDMRLFEAAGTWRTGGARGQGLDLFAGVRYIDVDLKVGFDPANPLLTGRVLDEGRSFTDFMLGVRYTWALSERWGLTLRGDGSLGDTDGTWNAGLTAHYRTGGGAWLFGYRHLQADLETDNAQAEVAMSGPTIGYGFRF